MFATPIICKTFLFVAGLHVEDSELKELCLIEIEKLLNSNGRSLKDYIVICHVQIVLSLISIKINSL